MQHSRGIPGHRKEKCEWVIGEWVKGMGIMGLIKRRDLGKGKSFEM